MRTILFTLALPFVLCGAVGATAQTKGMMSAPKADTVMLSETTDGNYLVRKYIVKSGGDTDYLLFYKIGTWELTPAFDANTRVLNQMDAFLSSIGKDSLMQIHSIIVTGYASPDGTLALNQKLAKGRAQSLKAYVDKKYNLSKSYNVMINSVALDWNAAREAIAKSDISDKQAVLNIIDQRDAAPAKERRLKAMPEVWKYLADKILPPMRYSEIAIMYMDGHLIEQRMMLSKPAPEPVIEECDPCDCVDVYESVSGLIVEMNDVGTDFQKMNCKERKQMHKAEKMVWKETKIAEKLDHKETKAAAKIAKKMDKEVLKMAKAEAKAAKKSIKKLEKM